MKKRKLGNIVVLKLEARKKKIAEMPKYTKIREFLCGIDFAISDRTIRRLIETNTISGFRLQHSSILYIDTEQIVEFIEKERARIGGNIEKHRKTV